MKPAPGFRIMSLHAFVALDPATDEEGVIAQRMIDGWMPMVAANPERLEQFRADATRIAKATGQTIKLVKFSVREDVETFSPMEPGHA